ncbi:glycosyltransferase family 4 protein [Candidatus Sumerlaeota bacterium]|nr:glycosyltransferase family 4 protein [Candidatus Sumerlaeota bacterium]
MQRLKIGIIGLRSPAASGGIESMVRQTTLRLARLGFDVKVFCRARYNRRRGPRVEGVRLVNVPSINTKHLETISYTFLGLALACLGRRRIVHLHALGPCLLAFMPRLFGKKVVVTVHGLDWKRDKWGFVARFALRVAERCAILFANRIVVVSKTLKRYFEARTRKEVVYIPNAVEPAEYLPLDGVGMRELERDGYVLFLGRLVPEKGAHVLIDAFKRVRTDKRLAIVGDARHDRKYGESLVNRAQGCDRIVFLGEMFDDQKERLIANAYLFVLPSFIEGMSIVLLEAMAHGVCPLVSDIEENLEVIASDSGEPCAGVSFRSGDAESLRASIESLLSDPGKTREIGAAARRKATREFNWDAVSDRYAEVYRDLAGV